MRSVWDAGYLEHQATVNGSVVNYAEGPNNGPALLLIHGQGTDWKSYYPALPALAASFHVFAVDVYGHGGSARVPAKYTNVAIGADLTEFISEVIGTQTIVTGHSSGGLICAWMAAHSPQWVRAVVLEDPPLLATTLPRAQSTWNWVDLASTCHGFLASGESDFVAYLVRGARIWTFFGEAPTSSSTWA
jgi:pimeloyl-ACP methyl ester carboxylesterase